MTNIYIIPVSYLHTFLNINENTSDTIVKREIITSQELDLMPVLGENLYQKILSDIDAGTLTGVYLTLVNSYIAKYLAFATYTRLLMTTSYKMANGNMYRSQSENSGEVPVSYLRAIQSQYEGDRDTYKERLINYLCNNNGVFPEYRNNDADQVKSHRDTLFGGISITNYGEVPSWKRSKKN